MPLRSSFLVPVAAFAAPRLFASARCDDVPRPACHERFDVVDDLVGERLDRLAARPGDVRRQDEAVGDGVLGKSVAEIAKAFRMEVLFSDYKGTTGMGRPARMASPVVPMPPALNWRAWCPVPTKVSIVRARKSARRMV